MCRSKKEEYFCRCHQCNKSFASKFLVYNHMETHIPISERPYKCNECPQSFSRPHLLTKHLRTGHMAGTQHFSCDICDKR